MTSWLFVIGAFLIGCNETKKANVEPAGTTSHYTTSHSAMPNQIEVGSTLDGKYRIVKMLGSVGDFDVLAAEHATIEKSYVVMTPSPRAGSGAGAALNDAAKRQAERGVSGEISVDDLGTTPTGTAYVVIGATDEQVKQLLSGSIKLGG
jgi:hypothetical protein